MSTAESTTDSTGLTVEGVQNLLSSPRAIAACLVVAVLIVYANTFSAPFVFDDVPELVHNIDVLSLRSCWNTIATSQNTGLSGRPVACLSFAANVAANGFDVRTFHLVNILIHVCSALVLFGIVRRTLLRTACDSRWVTPGAGLAALLWAIHPLQTESVTYVIQRIESLAALLYLLTLYFAIRSWDARRTSMWRVFSVLSCMLGMLTKETVATAPLVVLLYDAVFVSPSLIVALRRNGWLYVLMGCTWLIPAMLISFGPRSGTVGFNLGVSAADYLRTQSGVLVHYLRLVFWPSPQSISYSDWPIVRTWGPALSSGLCILSLLVLSVIGSCKRAWWGFCGMWFFLILAPSSSVVPIVTEPAAERRMYLPIAGVVCVVLFGAAALVRRSGILQRLRPEIGGVLGVALIVLAVGALGTRTVVRNGQYGSVIGLLSADLAVRPNDELMRGALVDELIHEQRIEEARSVHDAGLARNPQSYILQDNWARSMLALGRFEEAIEAFLLALRIRPHHQPSRAGLGLALLESGRLVEGVEELREAVRLSPNAHSVRANLAVGLARLGRTEEAIAELRAAVSLKPNFADGHFNLAQLLSSAGKINEAIPHFRAAADLRPEDPQIREALDQAMRKSGGGVGAPGLQR